MAIDSGEHKDRPGMRERRLARRRRRLQDAAGPSSRLRRERRERQRTVDFSSKLGPLAEGDARGPWSQDQGAEGLLRAPPLIDHKTRVMIYWSPKSACTSVYVWFAALGGFVDEVQSFNAKSPHQHRKLVFNRSAYFQQGIAMDPSELRVVKVLRDPFDRTVSIYRHALKTGFADGDMEWFSGGRLTADGGYSFHQFLDLLEALNFDRANIHYRPQLHAYEAVRKPDRIINISKSDMFGSLNEFAISCGLPPVDLGDFDWLHAMERGRKAKSQPVEGDDVDFMVFDQQAAAGDKPFPTYAQLLSPAAKERILKIYHMDFAAYGDCL